VQLTMKKLLLILLLAPAMAFGQTNDTVNVPGTIILHGLDTIALNYGLRNRLSWDYWDGDDSPYVLCDTVQYIIDTMKIEGAMFYWKDVGEESTFNKPASDNFMLQLTELWDGYKSECAKNTKVVGYRYILNESSGNGWISSSYEEVYFYPHLKYNQAQNGQPANTYIRKEEIKESEEPTLDGFMEYIKKKIQ